ncbi:hypothetical protein Tsubulata_031460 [Turnera subulata]|uniref:F-box domain-containing protein n=1 Tax=Turnera subulata TaxID=218843 RepID=A0A9Q0FT25_9ROSI|nr:hypothetical protein Tsubulata_031460 [Turnera subulata]
MDSSSPDQWSDLPVDLLAKIASFLRSSRLSTLRFRSVCRSWRSSAALPPHTPPLLSLPFPAAQVEPRHAGRTASLTELTLYSIQPLSDPHAASWIAAIRFSESGAAVASTNVLSRFPAVGEVPTPLPLPGVMDLRDFRVTEVTNVYSMEYLRRRAMFCLRREIALPVAVSSSFGEIGDGFTVMTALPAGKLALWKMGDDKWTVVNTSIGVSMFRTVIHHKGKFYGFSHRGLGVMIDPCSLKVTALPPAHDFGYVPYLVESSGDLFWASIQKDGEGEGRRDVLSYKVERFDEERSNWVAADDALEDRLFYIANDFSFSVMTRNLPGDKSDGFEDGKPKPRYFCFYTGSSIMFFNVDRSGRVRLLCNYYSCW